MSYHPLSDQNIKIIIINNNITIIVMISIIINISIITIIIITIFMYGSPARLVVIRLFLIIMLSDTSRKVMLSSWKYKLYLILYLSIVSFSL